MTKEDYIRIQAQIQLLVPTILEMNLEGFLDRISSTHSVAPLLDPTLYMKAMDRLMLLEQAARALHKCQQELARLRGREGPI